MGWPDAPPLAYAAGRLAVGLRDVTSDPTALDSSGFWAVVATFEGDLTCARFDRVVREPALRREWHGPRREEWVTSLGQAAYEEGVREVRERIAAGDVYQVNLCRVLTAPLAPEADVLGLAGRLRTGNPAPYAACVRLPEHGVEVACASPELFLGRRGDVVDSGPIKGTGRTAADLTPKDHAENVMIVDLVRNDLGRVCEPGSVTVPTLCGIERHPGLVHLVSRVRGRLGRGRGWADLLAATSPPGSVSGAPKSSALSLISALEPVARGPYCGAVGWVDADRREGVLAVGIRTFWAERAPGPTGGRVLRFGTGAGITWGSDPSREWRETELKAVRLLAVASCGGSS